MLSRVAGAAKSGGTPLIEPADDDGGGIVDILEPATVAIKDVQEVQVTPIPSTPTTPANRRAVGGGTAPSRLYRNYDNQYFFEDEVFRIDRQGRVQFGVVTETTESYSSDEDDDSDEALGHGEVRVAFYPDGKEIVQSEQSIGLADRTLMPGDVVRRRRPGQKDLGGQAGYVRDVNVRADVKVLGSKYVIKNVPAERLRPISEWSRDAPVCFGTWIGTTVDVGEAAVLRCSNGARLEITTNDFHRFKDAYTQCSVDVFNPNVYYPGNIVVGRLPPVDRIKNLTPDIPLPTNRKGRSMFTVESTRTTSIDVAWTCRAISSLDGSDVDFLKQPKSCVKGEELNNVKRLNIYESYMLQIHDRFYLKYSTCDKLIKYADWEEEQAATYLAIFQRQLLEENQSNEPNNSNSLANLEITPGSSSRTARNIPKFRRLANKQGSAVRLTRKPQEDNESSNISPKIANTAASKSRTCNNDETWDSVDEDEYEDDITDSQEAPESPEKLTVGGAEDITKQPENTAVAASTNASPAAQSPKISARFAKRRNTKKKMRSVKKLLTAPFGKKAKDPKDGDDLVVETLVVYSSVTVVWQDGSVETGIHSTQLYPIHHLDNHEFFPGDFVSNANVNGTAQTDYGVVQSVHHDERTAKVKWFDIYSHLDNPVPFCKDTEELSVYDLKDHSDYQYRPGTMVIRVSNFTGEDVDSTAGQVIENFPDGRVRVWWVKGHITMCYPQDLFEINHNDQEHEAYDSDGSEDSWETQSENSHIECSFNTSVASNDEDILIGLVQAKEAIKKQEKIFRLLPNERKREVLIDLIILYKNCRYLDCLLHTNFFHEEQFQGILKSSNDKHCQVEMTNEEEDEENTSPLHKDTSASENNIAQFTSTPTKRKSTTNLNAVLCKKCSEAASSKKEDELAAMTNDGVAPDTDDQCNLEDLLTKYRVEYKLLLGMARSSILKAFEGNKLISKNDSGVHSRCENSSTNLASQASDSKETSENTETHKATYTLEESSKPVMDNPIECAANRKGDNCEIFIFILKEQIGKCRNWIVKTYYKGSDKDKEDDDEEVNEIENAIEATEISKENPVTLIGEAKLDNDVGAEVAMEQQPLSLNVVCETLSPLESPMACSSPSRKVPLTSQSVSPSDESFFEVLPNAPAAHHFINMKVTPVCKAQFQKAIQREYRILQASLPPGVIVRAYEDRMDLLSVMMVGPKGTPYQNALFFFDFQMGKDYPKNPPTCLYISYCTERLNPNLYEEGKVCVSLLGTWSGKDTEMWSSGSTILQVLVSIQGLILVDEPYYNEAGYEKQRGTQLGKENSRVYNEMAIIKIAHSTVKQLQRPPQIFRKELIEHFKKYGNELHGRMQAWADYSSEAQRLKVLSIKDMPEEYQAKCEMPEFPLLPCSRGFCIAIKGVLAQLHDELASISNEKLPTNEINVTEAVAGTAPRAAPEEV